MLFTKHNNNLLPAVIVYIKIKILSIFLNSPNNNPDNEDLTRDEKTIRCYTDTDFCSKGYGANSAG